MYETEANCFNFTYKTHYTLMKSLIICKYWQLNVNKPNYIYMATAYCLCKSQCTVHALQEILKK